MIPLLFMSIGFAAGLLTAKFVKEYNKYKQDQNDFYVIIKDTSSYLAFKGKKNLKENTAYKLEGETPTSIKINGTWFAKSNTYNTKIKINKQ